MFDARVSSTHADARWVGGAGVWVNTTAPMLTAATLSAAAIISDLRKSSS